MKKAILAQGTKKAVIVYRALSFLKPNADFANGTKSVSTSDETQWFHIRANSQPQEVPDWIRETASYKDALAAKYIVEIEVKVGTDDDVLRPITMPRKTEIIEAPPQPMAAETRPLANYIRNSGIGVTF